MQQIAFLSTLSLRRATGSAGIITQGMIISIHALLAESDHRSLALRPVPPKFLSTLSLRRATQLTPIFAPPKWHFYPRSPCGERPQLGYIRPLSLCISIHALLAESDYSGLHFPLHAEISIHALLAESDVSFTLPVRLSVLFLSTLSLRRATLKTAITAVPQQISIHALLAESDDLPCTCHGAPYPFLSTLSLRRATTIYRGCPL